MAKNYNINKQTDIRKFTRDMAKIAAQKTESVKREFTFSMNSEENPSFFYHGSNVNFPYHYRLENENLLYIHRIICPKCLKEIVVRIGTNHCAWCDYQIEVDKNYPFLD